MSHSPARQRRELQNARFLLKTVKLWCVCVLFCSIKSILGSRSQSNGLLRESAGTETATVSSGDYKRGTEWAQKWMAQMAGMSPVTVLLTTPLLSPSRGPATTKVYKALVRVCRDQVNIHVTITALRHGWK